MYIEKIEGSKTIVPGIFKNLYDDFVRELQKHIISEAENKGKFNTNCDKCVLEFYYFFDHGSWKTGIWVKLLGIYGNEIWFRIGSTKNGGIVFSAGGKIEEKKCLIQKFVANYSLPNEFNKKGIWKEQNIQINNISEVFDNMCNRLNCICK